MWWFALACQPPPPLPEHTLVFGGDVTLGRGLNAALYDPSARARIFADLPLIAAADVALVNAEGVIAGGGRYYDKGESRPYTFRAHPAMIDVLRDAGVDVVTVGNNHANDYGPFALREMLDRLLLAGLDYAGGGYDRADARRPAYVQVDELVLAIVGGDLTYSEPHAATADLAGTLWAPGLDPRRADEVLATYAPIVAEARERADLVLFAPHWSENFEAEPRADTRALAADLLALGFDGILGHSAHALQGVEVIDGKPVIYDAGNLLSDFEPPPDARRTALFRLRLDRGGIRAVEVYPETLGANHTAPAVGPEAGRALAAYAAASRALGTTVLRARGHLEIPCDRPPRRVGPPFAAPPRRSPPVAVRAAESEVHAEAVPPSATPVAVRWENGVTLEGVEILMPELRVPKAGNVLTLYLRADRPQTDALTVALRPRGAGDHEDWQDHLPGDWLLPGSQWPVGALVVDRTLVRYLGAPEGRVELLVGLAVAGAPVPIVSSTLPTDGPYVVLDGGTYTEGAPRLWERWPRP